ncbi:unnamed protein product [Paramecium octaurelia]|uniref:Uncharacterized protein n=1 Tax=Paramecium octaurelia TaxID=43137 RepID=A0A8S1YL54_PAROT|nr:unnamed protein product [Paramecium octaurelia]
MVSSNNCVQKHKISGQQLRWQHNFCSIQMQPWQTPNDQNQHRIYNYQRSFELQKSCTEL